MSFRQVKALTFEAVLSVIIVYRLTQFNFKRLLKINHFKCQYNFYLCLFQSESN